MISRTVSIAHGLSLKNYLVLGEKFFLMKTNDYVYAIEIEEKDDSLGLERRYYFKDMSTAIGVITMHLSGLLCDISKYIASNPNYGKGPVYVDDALYDALWSMAGEYFERKKLQAKLEECAKMIGNVQI